MFKVPQKEDEDKILSLVKTVLDDYGLTINPAETDRDIQDIRKHYFDNNGYFEIYEKQGEIVGSYGICRMSETTCELRKMYLRQDYQGKGIGKIMLERAIQKAVELQYTAMVLETNKKLIRAIKLYSKYGFKEYPPEHMSDRCDYAMIKDLTI